MKIGRWLPAIFSIRRSLAGIHKELKRLADVEEAKYLGKMPENLALPDPPEEPLAVAYNSDVDYVRAELIENRLKQQLGRQPSPEEICNEIDGLEWDPAQPTVVVGRRQPGLH